MKCRLCGHSTHHSIGICGPCQSGEPPYRAVPESDRLHESGTFLDVDLFAAGGGWDEGAKPLGIRPVGIEWDMPACLTGRAAGHIRICADVAAFVTAPLADRVRGLIGSPPCTLFSGAGHGTAKLVIDELRQGVLDLLAGHDTREQVREHIYPVALADGQARNAKKKPEKRWTPERVAEVARTEAFTAALIVEPARYIHDLNPEWVVLEQVPEALPVWQTYVMALRERGWSAWCGVLNAANYGVPQTRERAILIASRVRTVQPPAPTHAKGGGADDLFGDALEPWVSMAQALGWNRPVELHHERGAGLVERHGERPGRTMDEPAFTVMAGSQGSGCRMEWVLANGAQKNATVRSVDQPAPTLLSSMDNGDTRWVMQTNQGNPRDGYHQVSVNEPAPTVTSVGSRSYNWRFMAAGVTGQGRPKNPDTQPADTLTGKGTACWTPESHDGSGEGSVRVTVQEAAILQSFRADYPWQGGKSKKFEQVGNAVPPLLATHVLAAVLGVPVPVEQEVAA